MVQILSSCFVNPDCRIIPACANNVRSRFTVPLLSNNVAQNLSCASIILEFDHMFKGNFRTKTAAI
jgi:hypothetical protein